MNTVLFENKLFTVLPLSSKANSSKMKNVVVTPVFYSEFSSHGYYGNNLYADDYYVTVSTVMVSMVTVTMLLVSMVTVTTVMVTATLATSKQCLSPPF